VTIATRVLEELRRSSRPLDDDDLARRLGLSHRQAVNQACRKLELEGRLRRYCGSGGKLVKEEVADPPGHPVAGHGDGPPAPDVSSVRRRAARLPDSAALPGFPVPAPVLAAVGFTPLELRVERLNVDLPSGVGCEWATAGAVPDSPGLYAFTVEDGLNQRVVYTHLWMVTKGRLPDGGGARGGQRYGRPKHAGATRRRVNILIAAQLRAGRQVRHWVRPLPALDLRAEEERLITTWELRTYGWNRG
jgi:hypothetical protein